MGLWGTVFNQSAGRVGADPAVRHAAYLALDANSMMKAAFSNLGVVFNTMVDAEHAVLRHRRSAS